MARTKLLFGLDFLSHEAPNLEMNTSENRKNFVFVIVVDFKSARV